MCFHTWCVFILKWPALNMAMFTSKVSKTTRENETSIVSWGLFPSKPPFILIFLVNLPCINGSSHSNLYWSFEADVHIISHTEVFPFECPFLVYRWFFPSILPFANGFSWFSHSNIHARLICAGTQPNIWTIHIFNFIRIHQCYNCVYFHYSIIIYFPYSNQPAHNPDEFPLEFG